jgi:hypothetical protein
MFIFIRAIGGEAVNGSLKTLARQEIELAPTPLRLAQGSATGLRACRERGWV